MRIAATYPNEKLIKARVPKVMEINNKLTTRRKAAALRDILKNSIHHFRSENTLELISYAQTP